jgi:hypothetical protein
MSQYFSKSITSPTEQAWERGRPTYSGTLGPNRTAADFTNAFVSKLKDNPDYNSFYTGSNFTQDSANLAQQKIDFSAQSFAPSFNNPADNPFAGDFLAKYTEGVNRGLISEEDRVGPDKLAMLASQPATAGSSQKSPNTVYKFPGEGGIQVG